MNVAIVILNWNGKSLLQSYLPSVCAAASAFNKDQNDLVHVYLADNASTDDSIIYCKQHFPEVQIIAMDENRGYAGGYNEALKHISSDVYGLLNSDVRVATNFIHSIVSRFKSNERIAALQPKILDDKQVTHFEYAGASGGFLDRFAYPYCRGRVFDTVEKDEGQYNDYKKIHWASGAALFVRASAFEEVGGFDERYFAHQEEIDLCWRLRLQSYEIGVEPESIVYHLGGASLEVANPQKTFYNFRNNLFNIVKNESSSFWFFIVFMRMILDGLAAIQLLFKGKPTHFWAVLRAHGSFYLHFIKMLSSRKAIQKFRNQFVSNFKFSVVLNYFVLGKNKFSSYHNK